MLVVLHGDMTKIDTMDYATFFSLMQWKNKRSDKNYKFIFSILYSTNRQKNKNTPGC